MMRGTASTTRAMIVSYETGAAPARVTSWRMESASSRLVSALTSRSRSLRREWWSSAFLTVTMTTESSQGLVM